MCTRLTLRVVEGRLDGKEFVFDSPTVCKIGRSEECELRLPDSWDFLDVSRRHCLLEVKPSGVYVRDLGSRNGTFVNGSSIGRRDKNLPLSALLREMPRCELADADELRVGGTVFCVGICSADVDMDRTPPVRSLCDFEAAGFDGPAIEMALPRNFP